MKLLVPPWGLSYWRWSLRKPLGNSEVWHLAPGFSRKQHGQKLWQEVLSQKNKVSRKGHPNSSNSKSIWFLLNEKNQDEKGRVLCVWIICNTIEKKAATSIGQEIMSSNKRNLGKNPLGTHRTENQIWNLYGNPLGTVATREPPVLYPAVEREPERSLWVGEPRFCTGKVMPFSDSLDKHCVVVYLWDLMDQD